LRTWGTALIEALDADGAVPDENTRSVNELSLHRHRTSDGGTLKARYDDAAMFEAIATLIDTLAQPRDKDDLRGDARRKAGVRWPTPAASSSTTAHTPTCRTPAAAAPTST